MAGMSEINAEERLQRHPLLEDFLLQYPSCEEDAAERAFLVYQDLTEVRGWWYTELAYNSPFDRPYVIGQRSRFMARQAVLPLSVEERISLHEMQQLFTRMLVDEEQINNIMLAVNEGDSTTVYYKLTSGLSAPDAPDIVAERKQAKDQRINRKRQHVASCVRQALQRVSHDVS